MPDFTVWTNATPEKTVKAHGRREAVSKYHEMVGDMPETWNGELHVRDQSGEECVYRRRQAA